MSSTNTESMRLIDTLNESEREVLVLKGMLANHKPIEKPSKMPNTITLKPAKNCEKKHSRVFEATTENDIVKSIYFLRPFADGVNEITLTVTRNTDAVVESM